MYFKSSAKKSAKEKADFLDAIGDEILALGDDLIQRCINESGLPEEMKTHLEFGSLSLIGKRVINIQ